MKEFCENQYCDSPGAKVVPVSVARPSDQKRTLCIPCEEAYTWGVQHGTITSEVSSEIPLVSKFLSGDGFVLVVKNSGDPSRLGPFEAWAYSGPLDFQAASPVTFGLGTSVAESLGALDGLLSGNIPRKGAGKPQDTHRRRCGKHHCHRHRAGNSRSTGLVIGRPHKDGGQEPLFRVAYVIDVNAANPREAAEYAHRIMIDPRSMPPVLQVVDHAGHVTTIDLPQEKPA
jgi:hypothetical protein